MSVFKRTRDPFYNSLLTDDNTIYCCTATGSDDNPGTREAPLKSLAGALKLNKSFICINDGIYNIPEIYGPVSHNNVFADKSSVVIKGDYYTYDHHVMNIQLERIIGEGVHSNNTTGFHNCYIYEFELAQKNLYHSEFNYVENFISRYIGRFIKNFTIKNFKNHYVQGDSILQDHIFTNEVDLYRYKNQGTSIYPVFEYCLFRKALKWTWNEVTIPVTYSENKENWITDLKNSLKNYAIGNLTGTNQDYLLAIVENSFQKGNIIHDDLNDTPVFNKYDNDNNPVDLTLFLDENNPALYMSSTESFVGAFFPNLKMNMGIIHNIYENGTYDPTIGGNLLIYNENDGSYEVNTTSYQKWNRVSSGVIKPNMRNFMFSGIQGILSSETNTKYYFGKKQQFNDNYIPVETIEVIPYDDENTVSQFPKFSCSLNEDTQIWFHKNGGPVLFNDLEGMNIKNSVNSDLYGEYAVTTADINSNDLMNRNDCIAKNIEIKYFKLEVNFHFSE
ncbi:MAG: hypothetical protein LBQ22_01845 [Bacteroidales bacterium]|jgi:hypothetical protein|nr:hypothetical protein [Bacteroidales bacterium]